MTTMKTTTTMAGERVDSDEDNDTTKTPTARSIDLIFDTPTNLWSDAFLAGNGVDFNNDDDDGNKTTTNTSGDFDNKDTRTTTRTPTTRTTTISFFDTTTNLWSDAFLAGSGGYLEMMTSATTTTKMRGDFDGRATATTTTKTMSTTTQGQH